MSVQLTFYNSLARRIQMMGDTAAALQTEVTELHNATKILSSSDFPKITTCRETCEAHIIHAQALLQQ